MIVPRQTAPTPIAYNLDGAAIAVGLSIFPIKLAVSNGSLTARYYGTKPLIGHAELLEWFENLPLDKLAPGEPRP
ncbi:hypothetical protein C3B61_03500 [Cryobacterium zongtaii]|uniref:Uncharacterized protein n=1 Tax=Cryobacterium zongtaii TaxID=1259217 RepID=A0A2S3ZKW6_9MICO|nr:hypothetical protein [Cryobacterium zongtaii]POH68978.1 hypothetical protein C3B61_03500 [Cryobacterium zongtaii]